MSQVKIPVPSNQYSHPLDCTHLTTLNFFQPLIALYQPVIKNTRINVNVGSLVRAIAMQRPAFADIKLRLRSFFVPYYSVMESFEAFLTGSPFHGSVVSTAPQIQYRTIIQFLLRHVKYSFYKTEGGTPDIPVVFQTSGQNKWTTDEWKQNTIALLRQLEDKHDFVVLDGASNFSWSSPRIRFWLLDLDYIGRAFLKMLYAFGFNLPFSAIMNANYGFNEFPLNTQASTDGDPLIGWYFLFRSSSSFPFTDAGLDDSQLITPNTDPRWSRLNIDTNKSKMPFLCVARIWEDWYISNQYQTYLNTIETFIHGTPSQSASVFNDVMEIILNSFYPSEKDIYMNAWDNPVSPNDSQSFGGSSSIVVNDPTNNSQRTSQVQIDDSPNPSPYYPNGTPYIRRSQDGSNITNFTQFLDTALHKLSDWVKRRQLSGSKAIDRYKNEYDETLSTEQLRRSYEIGHYDISLNIDEIMSNSDTFNPETGYGMKTGDYTGRMQGGSNINDVYFDFDSNQYFGVFIITATILPRIDYYQGLNPLLDNLKPEHFWHPDLDGLAPEVIAKEEYYNDFKLADFYNMPNSVADGKTAYGFTGSYHNIKSRQSVISGDFRLANRNVGYDCWHTFRDVNPLLIRENWSDYSSAELAQVLKHSPLTISTRNDLQQYNRLFAETDLDANDGFVCVFHFKIDMWNSSKPLYDTYDWYDEDCKKIDATINGTQLF